MHWKIESLGISSDDVFKLKNDKANPEAFQGATWRFAPAPSAPAAAVSDPSDAQLIADAEALKAKIQAEAAAKKVAAPSKQAAAAKAPAAPPKPVVKAPEPNAPPAPKEPEAPAGPSKDELLALPKTQLQEIAAAHGVSNVDQEKEKLVDEILGKQ